MPGGGNSRIPAEVLMQMQNMPKRELMRPAAPPQAQPNALQQAQAGLNAGKTITEGYKTGKSALFGAAPTPDDKEGLRGLFANTGKPEISGGWLDYVKNLGSSATPAARGGVMGYYAGGPVGSTGGGMPYSDDDTDSSNILGDVVKQGQQQHASLPKPGEALKDPQSGVGQLAQGVGALNSGMKAAQGLYTGAGKLGSMISGLGSAAEGAGAAAGAAEGIGAAAGAAGTLGSIGSGLAAAGSTVAEILPFLALIASDERAKHDKKKVGELYDGQPVYSYKYNGDNRTQLGLMAQNVERSHPEAVGSMNGMKMVDYDRATSDAADRGHFYSGGLVPRHGYQQGGPPAEGVREMANERRQLTERDIDYMARTMSREAANQGNEGLSGVGHVILNRFQSGKYGADIPSIVQADKQFSPWNKEAIGTRADPRLMSTDDPSYVKSAQIARAISNGEIPDPTRGALNFANPDLTNADWVRKMAADPEAIRIGQHVFGTSKGAGTGVAPARVQLASRDTGTATDATSGFRATADDLANRFVRSSPGAGPQQGGEGLGGLMKSEKFWIPLLSGLGAMAASPSRYLGSAILTGLGGGAEAYANLQKQQSGLESQQALTQKTYADISRENYNDKNRTIQIIDPKTGKWTSMLYGEYLMKYGHLPPDQRPRSDVRPAASIPPAPGDVMPPEPKKDTTIETTPLVPPAPVVKPPVVESGTPKPPAKPPAAPTVEPAKPSGSMFSASDSEVEEGRKFAFNRMTMGSTSPEPDLYGKQVDVALDASKQQQLLIPLTKELAAAPDSGLLEPGPLQKYMESVVAFANNAGRMFGAPEAFTSKDLQDKSSVQEVVRKLKVQLQGKQATDAQQHALAALQTFGEGIPGTLNSKKAVAEMIPQLLTANQRELDRNAFFVDYRKRAGGNTIHLQDAAGATSRFANEYFDAKFGNDFYQKERNALSKMFTDKFAPQDADGKQQGEPIPLISILSGGSPIGDKTKKKIEAQYGTGILRYFGIR